jgi:hypothetical protein
MGDISCLKTTEVAQIFWLLFSTVKVMSQLGEKLGWATYA